MKSRFPYSHAAWLAVALGVSLTSLALAAEPVKTTARERAAMEAAFSRADTNSDGRLSHEEAQRLPAVAVRFDELDTDKDGFLSLEEFASGLAMAA
jgi:Ca2+-binding EF-hand superfamily protein